MKRLLFLLLFPGLLASLFAYDYQTVYSHRTAMYQNREGKIIGFKTDSVVFNGDSVLYPLKNIQPTGQNCYTLTGASWMGGKIVIKPDWNYFFNENNDTLKIKTNARFHEGWKFFEDEDVVIEAVVYFHDTMTVLGVVDSVKTIELQAYYKNTPGKFAHETLLLSKRFGLAKTMNFALFSDQYDYIFFPRRLEPFELVGIDQPKLGVQNLTWFEVFDFQPGDEIHSLYRDGEFIGISFPFFHMETTTRDALRYLNRTNFADSIVYTIDRKQDVIAQKNDSIRWVTYRRDTIQTTIRRNEKFDQLPGTPVVDNYMAMLYSMNAGEHVSKTDMDQMIFFLNYGDECWTIPAWDGCMFVNKYLMGLGGPYGYCSGMGGETLKKELVYYKKGNDEKGVPFKRVNTNYKPLIQKTKSWQVLHSSCCPDIQNYRHTALLKLDQDTITNDHQVFTRLLLAKDPEGKDFRLQGYLRDDRITGRVYYKPANKRDKTFVLYDFEMLPGDTLMTTDFRMDQPVQVCNRVDSVDSVLVSGVMRRRLFISSYHVTMPGAVTPRVWIEGIGGTAGLLESSLPAMIGGEITQMLCVQAYGAEVYHHPELNNCFYWQDFKPATPYQTIYPERTSLFKDGQGMITGMKIDSVDFRNPQLYYPMKNVREAGEICYDATGASFLGEKILIEDGWNYYFDREGDTIRIKTDARIGESWTFCRKPYMLVQAKVVEIEGLTFAGITDSVKVIQLSVFTLTMNALPHPLQNTKLKCSRLNGWMNVFDFYDLPDANYTLPDFYELVGMDKPKTGIQNLTWFEVFDFQPGDEYHIQYDYTVYGGFPPETQLTETIRYIHTREDFKDSIVYQVSEKIQKSFLIGNQVQSINRTNNAYRWCIHRNEPFDQLPGQPYVHDNYLKSNHMKDDVFLQKGNSAIPFNPDTACFTYWTSYANDAGSYGTSGYYKGLGGRYYEEYGYFDEGVNEINKLVYFKKANQTWGIPFVFNSADNLAYNDGFAIFPNPTRGLLELKIDQFVPGVKVSVLDIHGSVILQQDVQSSGQILDMTALDTGIYFCRFTHGNEVLKVARFTKF